MTRSAKRITAVAIITVLAILLGFAVDFVWERFEQKAHPQSYMSYVRQYAYEYNIPEPVILAVIKVESDFDVRAESSKGAIGLMQMMPATFEDLTSDSFLGEHLDVSELYNPEISIKYGVYYLNFLYEMFDRNLDTALAAYNAGPGNVRKWLENPEYSDGNGNLTNIPFTETRNYVSKVNNEIDTYRKLYYTNQIEIEVSE